MATPSSDRIIGVNEFFAASEARVDRWRTLNRVAKALAAGGARPAGGHGPDPKALLAELAPLEDLCGYPGPRSDGAGARAPAGRRLDRLRAAGAADQRRASRQQLPGRPGALEGRRGGRGPPARRPAAVDRPRPGPRGRTSRSCSSRPPSGPCGPEIRETFRRLRRAEDEFVYEPVVVGSFEDAVLAVVFNHNLQAVVISDGFGYPSQYTMPGAARDPHPPGAGRRRRARSGDLGTLLAQMVRRWRPELDVYLTTDRDVAAARRLRRGGADPAHLLRGRGADGDPPGDPRRREGPLRDAVLRQPQEVRRSARSAPFTRCRSPAASRSSSRTGSATWASSTAPTCSSPSPRPPPAASTACSSRPATSRWRRTRRPAPSAATAASSSPTAPRRRTRSSTRRCSGRATSS